MTAAELYRRAGVLYRESRMEPNPTVARLLMQRSLRYAVAASIATASKS